MRFDDDDDDNDDYEDNDDEDDNDDGDNGYDDGDGDDDGNGVDDHNIDIKRMSNITKEVFLSSPKPLRNKNEFYKKIHTIFPSIK